MHFIALSLLFLHCIYAQFPSRDENTQEVRAVHVYDSPFKCASDQLDKRRRLERSITVADCLVRATFVDRSFDRSLYDRVGHFDRRPADRPPAIHRPARHGTAPFRINRDPARHDRPVRRPAGERAPCGEFDSV